MFENISRYEIKEDNRKELALEYISHVSFGSFDIESIKENSTDEIIDLAMAYFWQVYNTLGTVQSDMTGVFWTATKDILLEVNPYFFYPKWNNKPFAVIDFAMSLLDEEDQTAFALSGEAATCGVPIEDIFA